MNPKIETIKLENGLTICLYKDNTKHSTYASFITKFGGIDSAFSLDKEEHHIPDGVAHLLEHLLIEKSSCGHLLHTFGEMQLSCNGITYPYHTRYFVEGVEQVEEAIQILIKGIGEATFTKEDIEEVKPAIYEEIRRGNDNKWKQLSVLENEGFFKNIPYASTLGTIGDVKSITYEMLQNVYEAFYRPSNQIFVVAGNFDRDKIIKVLKTGFDKIALSSKTFQKIDLKEPKEINKKNIKKKIPLAQPIGFVCCKIDTEPYTPKEQVKLTYYLSYFLDMLFGVTSKFYKEAIKEKLITEEPSFDAFKIDAYFCIEIGSYTKDEKAFMKKVEETIKNPILDEEIFLMRKKNDKVEIAIRPESVAATIEPYLENVLLYDYDVIDKVEDIEAFTFEDFSHMMQNIDFSKSIKCSLIPEGKEKNK
ncbi:MAG: insulinase family protein [Bacilli bacterium]|nr:insulinase family protein [Bacilli bacterium]